MTRKPFDVIIIGAGVAGLTAARRISAAGKSVAIVEARNRIGGRIHTLHDRSAGMPIELGAEFIHGKSVETWKLLGLMGNVVVEIPDNHWYRQGDTLAPLGDFWEELDAVHKKMSRIQNDQSFGDFIDSHYRGRKRPREKDLAVSYVEGFHAAHTDRISVKSLVQMNEASEEVHGEKLFRFIDGYDALPYFLRDGIDPAKGKLHLNTMVQQVVWGNGHVEVQACSSYGYKLEPFKGKKALITLPVGVLQGQSAEHGVVQFDPPLKEKQAALKKIEMGNVMKVVLKFRERFWENEELVSTKCEQDLDKLTFIHSNDHRFPTWWTALPLHAPILTGWAGGPPAEKLLSLAEKYLLEHALNSLKEQLGIRRSVLEELLEGWYYHNWRADPFSRGAYTYLGVGGIEAPHQLSKPIDDTLYFAGEATNTEGHHGTVHGAIASGLRAAEEVISES